MGKKTNTVIVNFLLVPPKPGLFPGVGSKAGRQGYCIAGRAGKKTGAHLVKTQENSLVGSPPPTPSPALPGPASAMDLHCCHNGGAHTF